MQGREVGEGDCAVVELGEDFCGCGTGVCGDGHGDGMLVMMVGASSNREGIVCQSSM